MALAVAGSASSTRQQIVRALSPAGTKSATVKYLANEVLGLSVREVRETLEEMARAGLVKRRIHRSGEVLFRLKDRIDSAWEGQRGLSLPFQRQV